MKIYILLFAFLFSTIAAFAQKGPCNESQPRPIIGNQEPCAGTIETYCIENDRNYTSFEWDVPRAHAGEPPVGWKIISGQGTRCVTVLVGEKNGTMKVKVEDPICKTKVATLPVKPIECDGGGSQEPVCVITTDDDLFSFGYIGATATGDNTTVSFRVDNNTASPMEMVMIEVPAGAKPILTTAPAGFTAEVSQEEYLITYTRTDAGTAAGNEAVTFSFTIPTATHELIPFYNLSVFTTGGDFGNTGFNTDDCNDQPISALPVEFSSFSGRATASGVELAWTTASEKDNDRFEVQRSTNGKDFATVGTVKGAGNSATTLSYRFTDRKAATGTSYYRISQVDTDGTTALSQVIALEGSATQKTAGMSIYPNPVTGNTVNIAFGEAGSGDNRFVVVITDMNGRKVFEQQISAAGSEEIQLSLDQMKITKGLYMVKVQGATTTQTQKLIVR